MGINNIFIPQNISYNHKKKETLKKGNLFHFNIREY